MKLEYLASGPPDCPLIRLYDFTPADAEELRSTVSGLATGSMSLVDLDSLSWVDPVDGCRLALFCCEWDQGVMRTTEPNEWRCGLTASTWDNVAGRIEPFARGGNGFQWLADVPGEAGLLLSASPDGVW